MVRPRLGFLDRINYQISLMRWSASARDAASADLNTLRRDRTDARRLQKRLAELIFVAENRLAMPRVGSVSFPTPVGTDWTWRPDLWRGPLPEKGVAGVANKTPLGDDVTIYHDCKVSELTLRQLRNQKEEDFAPFSLRLDVFDFDGSFLSLALDLPDDVLEGLKRRHIIRVDVQIAFEHPIEMFARLNVRHGPNTEQIVRELPLNNPEVFVEFDLFHTKMHEKRVEKIWLDLIFESPVMNQVTIRDVTLCRFPRAEL